MIQSAKFDNVEDFNIFAKENNVKHLLTVKLNRVRDMYTTRWVKVKSLRIYYENLTNINIV